MERRGSTSAISIDPGARCALRIAHSALRIKSRPFMRYLHLDVFTSRPFEGNQLAVFPEPGHLSADMMRTIAAEMAFSESTFIYPPESGGDVRMRIFTPGEELPMAGHPTIGSTFALASDGVIAPGRERWVFELGVGPTPVSLEWDGDRLAFAWMTQPLPAFGPELRSRAALAAAVGIEERSLIANLPVQIVSCGVPFLFVPVATRTAVDAVSIDRRALRRVFGQEDLQELPVFFFTTDEGPDQSTVYSRMLAPGFGISEDPATGGASGPLGSYLLHHDVVTAEEARSMVSFQGVAMGRPSRIHISIDGSRREITRVRVGGQSVLVGRGELIE
jgi:trans-2,3-dihydro-3-hydroxyanthranilate isomerase